MNVADDPLPVGDNERKDRTANEKDNVTSSFCHSLSDFFLYYEIPKGVLFISCVLDSMKQIKIRIRGIASICNDLSLTALN